MQTLKTSILTALSASALTLAACAPKDKTASTPTAPAPAEISAPVTLASVISHPRRAEASARDVFRHPLETLEFFEVGPGKKVTEIWPGWYTDVIAPYLSENQGTYRAVLLPASLSERAAKRVEGYKEKYADTEVYGNIDYGSFYKDSYEIAPSGSQDIVLSFRNVHNWMGGGFENEAFKAFYDALKPGGILGIVEHRLPESATQNPKGNTGYVQESYMKALAADAGFEFIEGSEVNANPRDTADHPYGVWTLPPRSRLPKDDDPDKDEFDAQGYKNIGESDRATLKFKKPL